jgi:hypothetical protein
MTRIWQRLWVASLRDAEELAVANPHRITTVVSLCEACVAAPQQHLALLPHRVRGASDLG